MDKSALVNKISGFEYKVIVPCPGDVWQIGESILIFDQDRRLHIARSHGDVIQKRKIDITPQDLKVFDNKRASGV